MLSPARRGEFEQGILRARELLAGRVVWNVNSTARGGGVAELLESLVAYARGAGVDVRWVVIEGTPDFFAVTKRIHNRLHGAVGDGGRSTTPPAPSTSRYWLTTCPALSERVRPGDVVIVHDPQPAGLIAPLRAAGAAAIWRCHVGLDRPSVGPEEVVQLVEALDGGLAAEAAVWSSSIVEVEPAGEGVRAFVAVAVDGAVGPAAEHGADEALGLAVGARPVGAGAEVFDPERFAGERVDRGAVGVAVVGHQPLDADAEGGEVRDGAAKEADRGDRFLVLEHLDVDEAGRVVDRDVHVLPADGLWRAVMAWRARAGWSPSDAMSGAARIRPSFLTSTWTSSPGRALS